MKCPNCNGEIKRFDLAPNCKHCGVNIFYSQQKDLLARDAKKCELEYATARIIIAKLKTNFIKGPLQILRIVAMLMAIGSIFIPFATVNTALDVINAEFTFSALGIYNAFSDGTFFVLLDLIEYIPKEAGLCLLYLGLIVLIVLMGLGVFISLVLSFINIIKGAKVMRALAVSGSVFCVACAVLGFVMPSVFSGFLVAESGVGAIICCMVFVMIFILNHLVIKKNITPQIDELDIKRVEMRKKVKKGEVNIDDLPLPVFVSPDREEKGKAVTEVE